MTLFTSCFLTIISSIIAGVALHFILKLLDKPKLSDDNLKRSMNASPSPSIAVVHYPEKQTSLGEQLNARIYNSNVFYLIITFLLLYIFLYAPNVGDAFKGGHFFSGNHKLQLFVPTLILHTTILYFVVNIFSYYISKSLIAFFIKQKFRMTLVNYQQTRIIIFAILASVAAFFYYQLMYNMTYKTAATSILALFAVIALSAMKENK